MSKRKLRVEYRYSVWKSGRGWELEDSYMGIDDTYTDDYAVLSYNKDDLITDMVGYVSNEINTYDANGRYDTCYTYAVYNAKTDAKLLSVSVWLSELVNN